MLNRPATKIEINIEEENIEYEEMKNFIVQNMMNLKEHFKLIIFLNYDQIIKKK